MQITHIHVRENCDDEVKMMDDSGFQVAYCLYPGCPLAPVPPSWLFYQKSCWRNLLLPVSVPLPSSSPSPSALTWSPVGGRVKFLVWVTWSAVKRNWTGLCVCSSVFIMFTSIWACCRAKVMLNTSRTFSRSWGKQTPVSRINSCTDPSISNGCIVYWSPY